jgi:hypothetical protein
MNDHKTVYIMGMPYEFARHYPPADYSIPDMPNCIYCKHLTFIEEGGRFIHCALFNEYLCTVSDKELKNRALVKLLHTSNPKPSHVKWAGCHLCELHNRKRIPTSNYQDPLESDLYIIPDCQKCAHFKQKQMSPASQKQTEPHSVICEIYPFGRPADWSRRLGGNTCNDYRPLKGCADLHKLKRPPSNRGVFSARQERSKIQDWVKISDSKPYVTYGSCPSAEVLAFLSPFYLGDILPNLTPKKTFKTTFNAGQIQVCNYSSLCLFMHITDTQSAEIAAAQGKEQPAKKPPKNTTFLSIPHTTIPGKIFAYRRYKLNRYESEGTTNSTCGQIQFEEERGYHQHFFDAHPETTIPWFNSTFENFDQQEPDIPELARAYKISPYFLGLASNVNPHPITKEEYKKIPESLFAFPNLLQTDISAEDEAADLEMTEILASGIVFNKKSPVNLLTWLEDRLKAEISVPIPESNQEKITVNDVKEAVFQVKSGGKIEIKTDPTNKIYQQTVATTLYAAGSLEKTKAMLTRLFNFEFAADTVFAAEKAFEITTLQERHAFFMECQYLFDQHFGSTTAVKSRSTQNTINGLLEKEFFALMYGVTSDPNIISIKNPPKSYKKWTQTQKEAIKQTHRDTIKAKGKTLPLNLQPTFRKAVITGFLYHFYYTHGVYLTKSEIEFMFNMIKVTSALRKGVTAEKLKEIAKTARDASKALGRSSGLTGSKTVAIADHLNMTNQEMDVIIHPFLTEEAYKADFQRDTVFKKLLYGDDQSVKDPDSPFNWSALHKEIQPAKIKNNPATLRLARLIYYAERRMMRRALAWGVRAIQQPINNVLQNVGQTIRETDSTGDYQTDMDEFLTGSEDKKIPANNDYSNLSDYQQDRVDAFVATSVVGLANRMKKAKNLLEDLGQLEPVIAGFFAAKCPVRGENPLTWIPGESQKVSNASRDLIFFRSLVAGQEPFKAKQNFTKWKEKQAKLIGAIKEKINDEEKPLYDPLLRKIRCGGLIGFLVAGVPETIDSVENYCHEILPLFGKSTKEEQLIEIMAICQDIYNPEGDEPLGLAEITQEFPLFWTLKEEASIPDDAQTPVSGTNMAPGDKKDTAVTEPPTEEPKAAILSQDFLLSITELAERLRTKILGELEKANLTKLKELFEKATDENTASPDRTPLSALKAKFRDELAEGIKDKSHGEQAMLKVLNRVVESWLKLKILHKAIAIHSHKFRAVLNTRAYIHPRLPSTIGVNIGAIIKSDGEIKSTLRNSNLPTSYSKFDMEFVGAWNIFLTKSLLDKKLSEFPAGLKEYVEKWSLKETSILKKPKVGSMPVSQADDCIIGSSMFDATQSAIENGTIPFIVRLDNSLFDEDQFKKFVCYPDPKNWTPTVLSELKNTSMESWIQATKNSVSELRKSITEAEITYLQEKTAQIHFLLQKVGDLSTKNDLPDHIAEYLSNPIFDSLKTKVGFESGETTSPPKPDKEILLENSIILKQKLGNIDFANRYLVWNAAREERRKAYESKPNRDILNNDRSERYRLIKDSLYDILLKNMTSKPSGGTSKGEQTYELPAHIKIPKSIQSKLCPTKDNTKWNGLVQSASLLRPQFPSQALHANVSISYEYSDDVKSTQAQIKNAGATLKPILEKTLKKPIDPSNIPTGSETASDLGSILALDLNRINCMRQVAYGLISLDSASKIDLWDLNIPLKDIDPDYLNNIDSKPLTLIIKAIIDSTASPIASKILNLYLTPTSLSQPTASHPFGGWSKSGDVELSEKGLVYPHNAYEGSREPTLADLFGALIYYFGVKREHLKSHIFAVAKKLEATTDSIAIPRLRSELYYLKKKFKTCRPKMLDIMIRETALLILSANISAVAGENLQFQKTVGSLAKIQAGMVKGVNKFWTPVSQLVEANGGEIPHFKLVSPWGTSKYDLFNSAALGLYSVDLEDFSFEEVDAIFEEEPTPPLPSTSSTSSAPNAPPPPSESEKEFENLKKYIKAVLCLDDSATSADWGVTADLESDTQLWRITPRHDSSGVSIAARYIEEVSKSRKNVKKTLIIREILKRFLPRRRIKVFPSYNELGGIIVDTVPNGTKFKFTAQFINLKTTVNKERVVLFAFEDKEPVDLKLLNAEAIFASVTHIHCTPKPDFFLRPGEFYDVIGEKTEYDKRDGEKGFGMCNCKYTHVY